MRNHTNKEDGFFPILFILIGVLVLVVGAGLLFFRNQIPFLSNYSQNPENITIASEDQKKELDKLTIGLVAGLNDSVEQRFYPNVDPNMPGTAVTTQMLEALVGRDNNYKIQPLLAESWQNIDDTTWRFNLRKNVRFSNGNEFTAVDVKFTYDVIKDNPKWATAQFIRDIKTVDIVSPYVVDIKTEKPSWALLSFLTRLFILDHNSFKATDLSLPTGTGPYIFSEGKVDKYITLTRNENYWGSKAKAKTVTYKVIGDNTERIQALKNGEVDIVEYVPNDQISTLKQDPNFKVVNSQSHYVWFVSFDQQRDKTPYTDTDKNPFKDIRVRQAVYHAINVDDVIQETYKGNGFSQSQLATNAVFGYNPAIKRLPYNLEKAKQLLAEAGYPNGFKVNIDVYHPKSGEYAQAVVNQLKKVGIDTKVTVRRQNETSVADRAKFEAGDTSMFFTAASGLGDGSAQLILSAFLHTRTKDNTYGVENLGSYSNPKVDDLIEKSANEMNESKRLTLMQDAMKVALVDDVSYVPVNTDGIAYAFRKGIYFNSRNDGHVSAYEIAGLDN